MYNCIFKCEIAIVISRVPLKGGKAELHIDTKNKTKRAEMTDVEMAEILAEGIFELGANQ